MVMAIWVIMGIIAVLLSGIGVVQQLTLSQVIVVAASTAQIALVVVLVAANNEEKCEETRPLRPC
jgi:hypothetical protein